MSSAPHSEIDWLRERYAALDPDALAADGAALTASVATWRWSEPGSGAHRPEPWWRVREHVGDPGGGWLDARADGADVDRVGFDTDGRAIIVEAHRGNDVTVVEVWSHGSDGSRMGRIGGAEDRAVVWIDRWTEPTKVASLGLCSFWIEDEKGSEPVQQSSVAMEQWRWEDGIAVEGTVTERVEGAEDMDFLAEEGSPATYAFERTDVQRRLVVHGALTIWMSTPAIRDEQVLTEVLASGLERAIVAGVANSGVERPFVVEYRSGGSLPGFVRVGGEAFRDANRQRSPKDGAALERLYVADENGRGEDVAGFMLGDLVDEDTALACREIEAAASMISAGEEGEVFWWIAHRTLTTVAERLTERLNEPGIFGETAEPFLSRVLVGTSEVSDEEADELARRVLGDERADAFAASLTSTRAKPKGRKVSVKAARTDRAKLATWLEHQGIDDGAAVAAAAEPAFRLVKPASGAPRPGTRLHGAGLLPPDTPWPKTEAGRDLAFLAAVDLGELGDPLPGGPALPEAGWLLFFADIECNFEMTDDLMEVVEDPDAPDDESTFYGEATPNVEGSDARLFYLAPGTEPLDAEPPPSRSGKRGWPEDRRVARAELTLPTHYEANEQLGIDEAIELWEVFEPLLGGDVDWILGAATGVQGQPIEDGSVLLLHLASVEFQDGGAIQFRIPPDALAAGDWSQAYAVADSC